MSPMTRKSEEPTVEVPLTQSDERLQEMANQAPPFYKNGNLLKLYLCIIPGCLVPAITLGYDSAMMNGLQSVPAWETYFHNPKGAALGILTASLALGAIVGIPFMTFVGDRYGRRMAIFTGATFMLIGAAIQAGSQNIAMFLVSRILIGFGFIFANACAPMLIGELAHPKERQVVTSLYQSSWYFGSVVAAWITFGTFNIPSNWSWRIPSLLQTIPAIVQMIGVWTLPESPRWLISKGKSEEAKAMLVKYHANGDEDNEFVKLEYIEMKNVIELEMANETTWKTLVATPGNRRRMMILVCLGLFSQWSGNGLISFYLSKVLNTIGITSARDQNIINGTLQIWNWITAIVSSFLTAYLKRRTQFGISVCGMLICFVLQTTFAGLFAERGNTNAGIGVVPMLFLFYVFFNLAFNALVYAYPVEILPFPIRAKGFAVLMFFGKAANFVNGFVNPIGLKAIGWKYYLVYVGWLCVEVVLTFLLIVETKGPTLEGIAAKFDKDIFIATDGKALEEEDEIEIDAQSVKKE